MIQTADTYYSSEDNYGKYQYCSLKDIINELLGDTIDPDHHLSNTKRSTLVMKAKNGIRVLSREIKKTVLAMEVTISPKLYIPLPQNYMDWVRVSVVQPDYRLKALKINYEMPTAVGYLQDHDYDLLFDSNGEILSADSSNLFNKPYKKQYSFCKDGGQYGEFVIDERRGVIGFSSDLVDKEVVIEYISDGIDMANLKEEEITIHKNIKDALLKLVYKECIIGRRTVPQNEKYRATQEYKAALHTAKKDNLHFNIAELADAI